MSYTYIFEAIFKIVIYFNKIIAQALQNNGMNIY
jgi:hypothetical protein